MSHHLQAHRAPESLQREISWADAVTAELASAVLDLALVRCAAPNRAQRAQRVRELIGVQAWTDAALALVELDRSRVVRRLYHDDGEWHCMIGSQWPMPDWLDDTVELGHPVLPLAILGALIDALDQNRAVPARATSVPQSRSDMSDTTAAICCDNFA
jgi:hypothetical protein